MLLHRQSGASYNLPAVSSTEFFSRRIVEDDIGIGMAAFLRHTAEAYFVCDPAWRNPAWRDDALRKLEIKVREDCQRYDIRQVMSFVEPSNRLVINKLKNHNWDYYKKGEWKCFSQEVNCG